MKHLSEAAKAAQLIRKELKTKFTGIKFAVNSQNYSGGNSIRVSWTNGPTVKEVKEITSKYEYGHFDGMTDMYEYSNNRSDIPQVKYVFEEREIERELKQKAFKVIKEHSSDSFTDYDIERVVRSFFEKQSIPANLINIEVLHNDDNTAGFFEDFFKLEGVKKSKEKIQAPSGVEVLNYSDKSIAVTGNTKPIKDDLKALGGRFNFRLTCGPGWIFPLSKKEEVFEFLGK